jgi:HSP20 family molecular chaperone IbpA
MTQLLYSGNSPWFGFEALDRLLTWSGQNSGDSYPPFNIEQPTSDSLRIELAVAGFAPEDLSVQVEGDQLIVRGRRSEPQGRTYLHRGIAARQFKRRFQLANGFQVESAHLENGMLAIDIRRATTVTPVQKIAIR